MHAFFARYFEPFGSETGSMDSDFSFDLHWKDGVLPNADWPAEYLEPENARFRASLCMVGVGGGSRISFPLGLIIPISPEEESSYEFLGRFAADAPIRMSPKHFSVGVPRGTKGHLQWRKVQGNLWRAWRR
jgi:hypothetical protein